MMVEKMFFKIEDDNILVKYNEIWKKTKKHYTNFHSQTIYNGKIHKNLSKNAMM